MSSPRPSIVQNGRFVKEADEMYNWEFPISIEKDGIKRCEASVLAREFLSAN